MRNLLLAFVCAFTVTADALDLKKELQNLKQPQVVSVYNDGSRICTGVMIFDLTILTTSDRFVGDNKAKYNMTIKFPNDKKLYQTALKVYSKNLRNVKKYDIEFAILTLDEKDKPPKCEWTFQLPKSEKHGNKGQVTLIRNYKDKDVVKTMDVPLVDCEKYEESWYNLTRTICVNGGATWETNNEDQGAPLSIDGEFAGVMISQEDPPNPSFYEFLYYDKEFFEKLPQNPSKHEKSEKNKKTKTAH